ncbi:MAG: DUF3106 domain-containing protein [Bryobacteraceae bacterium]|jgi:hypothetical protein
MNRWVELGAVLLLGAVAGLCGDQKPAAKAPPPPPRPAPVKPPAKNNAAKGGVPKANAQRLVNPANPATRLFRMTPEQRERAFEQMNPQQQESARKLMQWFDGLPKEQQATQLRQLARFEQLPQEQRMEVKGLIKEAQDLPADRRLLVRQALARLQNLPDADRDRFLNSPAFKGRFSAEEQRVITRLADAWLPPF